MPAAIANMICTAMIDRKGITEFMHNKERWLSDAAERSINANRSSPS
jgi:hypothetical protein